jgi:hypothetical protein
LSIGFGGGKIHAYKNNCILYHGSKYEDLEKALFVDSIDSIVEKTAMMMGTATETEEKAGLKRCFGTFLSFLL